MRHNCTHPPRALKWGEFSSTEAGGSFIISFSVFCSDCLVLWLQNTHFYLLSKKRVPAAVSSNKSLQVSHRGTTSLICTHKAGVMQDVKKRQWPAPAGTLKKSILINSGEVVPYRLPKNFPCMRAVGFGKCWSEVKESAIIAADHR